MLNTPEIASFIQILDLIRYIEFEAIPVTDTYLSTHGFRQV